MASGRKRFSGLLTAAVSASVAGLIGIALVPTASASVITLEAVPVSATNADNSPTTVSGQNVTLDGPGTVNYNLVAVIHGGTAAQNTDGLLQLSGSLLSESGGSLGTLTYANTAAFSQTGQNGTPTGTPPGTDIGPDRPGVANSLRSETFFPSSTTLNYVTGTSTDPGDAPFIVGSGTFVVSATSGSTTLQPLFHWDTSNSFGHTISFEVGGVAYSLNGNGNGTAGPNSVNDPTLLDTLPANVSIVPTPEPGSVALLGLGGLGLLMRRRRK